MTAAVVCHILHYNKQCAAYHVRSHRREKRAISKTKQTANEKQSRTAWHPLAFQAIKAFTPKGYEVKEEFPLGSLPQRIDILIILRRRLAQVEIEGLDVIMTRLNRYTIVEVKAPTDRLEAQDFMIISGYALQYMVLRKCLAPGELTLFTLSDGIPAGFRKQVARFGGSMREISPGLWSCEGLYFKLFCIDTGPASETPGNHLLYFFTKKLLENPRRIVPLLGPREYEIYSQMASRVVQLNRKTDDIQYRGLEMIQRSFEEITQDIINTLPPEKRMRGLKPEERVRGLPPEERLRGLPPEERVRGLTVEERVKGLTFEELMQGLSPEERDAMRRAFER